MPIKLYILDVQKLSDMFSGKLGPRVFTKKFDADMCYDLLTQLGCKVKRYTVYQKTDNAWSI